MGSVQAVCLSDVGRKRLVNEDSVWALPEVGVFGVADGVGGSGGGAFASATVKQCIEETCAAPDFKQLPLSERVRRIQAAAQRASSRMRTQGRDIGLSNIASTALVLLLDYEDAYVVHCRVLHAGDSRMYVFRNQQLIQVTRDHSTEQIALERGLPAERLPNEWRSAVTRAISAWDSSRMDTTPFLPKTGDICLLCTDGLYKMVADAHMEAILNTYRDDLDVCARTLVAAANDAGGKDNISLVLVRLNQVRESVPDKLEPASADLETKDTTTTPHTGSDSSDSYVESITLDFPTVIGAGSDGFSDPSLHSGSAPIRWLRNRLNQLFLFWRVGRRPLMGRTMLVFLIACVSLAIALVLLIWARSDSSDKKAGRLFHASEADPRAGDALMNRFREADSPHEPSGVEMVLLEQAQTQGDGVPATATVDGRSSLAANDALSVSAATEREAGGEKEAPDAQESVTTQGGETSAMEVAAPSSGVVADPEPIVAGEEVDLRRAPEEPDLEALVRSALQDGAWACLAAAVEKASLEDAFQRIPEDLREADPAFWLRLWHRLEAVSNDGVRVAAHVRRRMKERFPLPLRPPELPLDEDATAEACVRTLQNYERDLNDWLQAEIRAIQERISKLKLLGEGQPSKLESAARLLKVNPASLEQKLQLLLARARFDNMDDVRKEFVLICRRESLAPHRIIEYWQSEQDFWNTLNQIMPPHLVNRRLAELGRQGESPYRMSLPTKSWPGTQPGSVPGLRELNEIVSIISYLVQLGENVAGSALSL